jgi:sulfatase maturation enzyme AslB (radical SAM superfamily)
MYVQITNKCNMHCAHCCYSCGPDGEFMSRRTFIRACKIAEQNGENIFLGGGEPTLHPHFWEFLGLALRYNGTDSEIEVGVITNGSRTDDALALARLAKRGAIYAGLSQDEWHASIDKMVVMAFTKNNKSYGSRNDGPVDLREIRSVGSPHAQGRAKDWGGDGCCCPEIVVVPDGRIFGCGCLSVQLGTVEHPEVKDWGRHECSKKMAETPIEEEA